MSLLLAVTGEIPITITSISGISKAYISGIAALYILPPDSVILSSTSGSAPNAITSITYLLDGKPL